MFVDDWSWFEWIVLLPALFMVAGVVVLPLGFAYGYLERRLNPTAETASPDRYGPIKRVAILIAAYNEELVIQDSVRAARACRLDGDALDVWVVANGCTDRTVELAAAAGAITHNIVEGIGKPAALYRAIEEHDLYQRYDAFAVVDADTIVDVDFVQTLVDRADGNTAAVVGKTFSNWPRQGRGRWNPLLASRAYSYETYQLLIRRIQSWLGVMNCIAGSNSLLRVEVLREVLLPVTPVLVDDTWWTHAIHRDGLGDIVYAPRSKAWVSDPTTFREWYSQNMRWIHGTMQAIYQFRVPFRPTLFDLAYAVLFVNWITYIASGPIALWLLLTVDDRLRFAGLIGLGYVLWATFIAFRLKRPAIFFLLPGIYVMDLAYRMLMVHAFFRTIRQPRSEGCVWESPDRNYALR